jgi:hypothetical protein
MNENVASQGLVVQFDGGWGEERNCWDGRRDGGD